MLQTMLLTIVALPLALGIVAALAAEAVPPRRAVLLALLVPLAAAVAAIALEGLPAFPPVRSTHKLPFILAGGGIVLAIAAWRARPAGAALATAFAAALLIVPVWWLGRNVLANNATKASVTAILVVLAVLGIAWQAARKGKAAEGQTADVLPQAVFATALATALISVLGGYIGMAQFNGALAALFGGYLLVAYVRLLKGSEAAFALPGGAALALAWTAAIGLLMTAIFAPNASSAALVAAILTLVLTPLAAQYGPSLSRLPRALRPLGLGFIAAVPALAAIAIAALQYSG